MDGAGDARGEREAQILVQEAQGRVAEMREKRRKSKPQSIGGGLKQGGKHFVGGLAAGVAGLLLTPVASTASAPKGKKLQGALSGVVGGLAIGLAAPVVGTTTAASKIYQGATAGGREEEYKALMPPPDSSAAEIQAALKEDREAYLRERSEVYHGLVADDLTNSLPTALGAGVGGGGGDGENGLPVPVDVSYYEALELSHDATAGQIRKAYHKRSLATHPDRTASDGKEFKVVSEAYQVLSDPEKRLDYHKNGISDSVTEGMVKADLLYALMLMPSGFKPLIGDAAHAMMLATEAKNPPNETEEMLTFHKQRVEELANLLVLRIAPYVEGRESEFVAFAEKEVAVLSAEPLGSDILRTVGYAYSSKAKVLAGAASSVPLRGFFSELAGASQAIKKQLDVALSVRQMQVEDMKEEASQDVDEAERRRAVTGLSALYLSGSVEIQSCLREVVEVVCTDASQPKEVLQKRIAAIHALGSIFSSA